MNHDKENSIPAPGVPLPLHDPSHPLNAHGVPAWVRWLAAILSGPLLILSYSGIKQMGSQSSSHSQEDDNAEAIKKINERLDQLTKNLNRLLDRGYYLRAPRVEGPPTIEDLDEK